MNVRHIFSKFFVEKSLHTLLNGSRKIDFFFHYFKFSSDFSIFFPWALIGLIATALNILLYDLFYTHTKKLMYQLHELLQSIDHLFRMISNKTKI